MIAPGRNDRSVLTEEADEASLTKEKVKTLHWRIAAVLLSVGLFHSIVARAQVWHAPDNGAITAEIPGSPDWTALPIKTDADGSSFSSWRRADGSQFTSIAIKKGLPAQELTAEIYNGMEQGILGKGVTKLGSGFMMLDGHRAAWLTVRRTIDGDALVDSDVFAIVDGVLYGAVALSKKGDPFDDPDLSRFLLSLHLPPGEPSARQHAPKADFSVVLPTGSEWSPDKDVGGTLLRSIHTPDFSAVLNVLQSEAKAATLTPEIVASIDQELFGEPNAQKRVGHIFKLESGQVAYFTVGTRLVRTTTVYLAAVFTVANGHLTGISTVARGDPMKVPALNRALFSLTVP